MFGFFVNCCGPHFEKKKEDQEKHQENDPLLSASSSGFDESKFITEDTIMASTSDYDTERPLLDSELLIPHNGANSLNHRDTSIPINIPTHNRNNPSVSTLISDDSFNDYNLDEEDIFPMDYSSDCELLDKFECVDSLEVKYSKDMRQRVRERKITFESLDHESIEKIYKDDDKFLFNYPQEKIRMIPKNFFKEKSFDKLNQHFENLKIYKNDKLAAEKMFGFEKDKIDQNSCVQVLPEDTLDLSKDDYYIEKKNHGIKKCLKFSDSESMFKNSSYPEEPLKNMEKMMLKKDFGTPKPSNYFGKFCPNSYEDQSANSASDETASTSNSNEKDDDLIKFIEKKKPQKVPVTATSSEALYEQACSTSYYFDDDAYLEDVDYFRCLTGKGSYQHIHYENLFFDLPSSVESDSNESESDFCPRTNTPVGKDERVEKAAVRKEKGLVTSL